MIVNTDMSKDDLNRYFRFDVNHLKQHLGEQLSDKDVSQKKAVMLNFKVHDTNNDGYLDGLELRRMISHESEMVGEHSSHLTDEAMVKLVDQMLQMADTNNDALVSYTEFAKILEANK